MTKALDARNARLRAKAGDKPYYKLVIETVKACPYCDASLKRTGNISIYECDCGLWSASYYGFNEWSYQTAPTAIKESGE